MFASPAQAADDLICKDLIGLEQGRQPLPDIGGLREIQRAFLGIAALNNFDGFFGLRLEEMHTLDQALHKALDDIGVARDEAKA